MRQRPPAPSPRLLSLSVAILSIPLAANAQLFENLKAFGNRLKVGDPQIAAHRREGPRGSAKLTSTATAGRISLSATWTARSPSTSRRGRVLSAHRSTSSRARRSYAGSPVRTLLAMATPISAPPPPSMGKSSSSPIRGTGLQPYPKYNHRCLARRPQSGSR